MSNQSSALAFVLVVAIAAQTDHLHASLINGSFETGDFTGWTVSGNVSIQPFLSSDGMFAAHFNRFDLPANGRLTQSFPTVVGVAYELQFDHARIGDIAQILTVDVIGTTTLVSQIISDPFPSSAIDPNPSYETYGFPFIADSAFTTLSFRDEGGSGSTDTLLDNVRVIVPEPSSLATILLGFAGIGWSTRRRAQNCSPLALRTGRSSKLLGDALLRRIIRFGPILVMAFASNMPPRSASATVAVFTSESSYLAAVVGLSQSFVDFDSSPPGSILGTEFAGQGLTFSSPLIGPVGQLRIRGPESGIPSAYLNIGEAPGQCCDGNNDSLEVMLIGDWYGAAFGIIDSALPTSGESITFLGNTNNILYQRVSGDGAISFLGILANEPVRRISILEAANDEDDVGYDNFRLAVPEPASLTCAVVACTALAFARFTGLRKHRG